MDIEIHQDEVNRESGKFLRKFKILSRVDSMSGSLRFPGFQEYIFTNESKRGRPPVFSGCWTGRSGPYSLNIACQGLSRLAGKKDLLNRRGGGTIPQTQSHEKTLPSRDRQTPAAPGQEAFLTPYLTTVGAGTRGNSGFKSAKKYLIPSEKRRKALQITTKNLVQAFGSRRPGVRVPALRPPLVEKPPFQAVFLRFLFCFCSLDDCCSAVVQGAEKRQEHERG